MTKDEAFARVLKLRQMTVARGASANEARIAAKKADGLVARFGLDMSPPPRREPRARQVARPGRPAPARVFVFGPEWPTDWSFNAKTGEASENVRVHHHRGVGNWKIEIDPDVDADERWGQLSGKAE